MTRTCWLVLAAILSLGVQQARAQENVGLPSFRWQELESGLGVGYAVSLTDVNHDGKLDIVVVDTDKVLWYENPTWKKRIIIQGGTKKDNVCIAAHDIDGDGLVDFALGAAWKPFEQSGTLQWLKRGKSLDEQWTIYPIDTEPLIHRVRFADIDGDGKLELISVPLMGRNSTAKANFMDGSPVRVTAYHIPRDPTKDRWTPTILDESLHVCHNFAPIDSGKKHKNILVTAYEGVFLLSKTDDKWQKLQVGAGNQDNPKGKRGASEIKQGSLKSGSKFIATVEPWHGDQIVVYSQPAEKGQLWNRHIIDEQLRWGHAVWTADLDGDGNEELIIGVRDDPSPKDTNFLRRGVRVYKAQDDKGSKWARQVVDNGGMSCEDLAAADLDGDGKIDIVAVGRFTHNVRIYWNEGRNK